MTPNGAACSSAGHPSWSGWTKSGQPCTAWSGRCRLRRADGSDRQDRSPDRCPAIRARSSVERMPGPVAVGTRCGHRTRGLVGLGLRRLAAAGRPGRVHRRTSSRTLRGCASCRRREPAAGLSAAPLPKGVCRGPSATIRASEGSRQFARCAPTGTLASRIRKSRPYGAAGRTRVHPDRQPDRHLTASPSDRR